MDSGARKAIAPVVVGLLLMVCSGLAAIYASAAAEAYHPSLNITRPPLARVEPVVGEGSPRLARRVVLVVVDGLRLLDSSRLTILSELSATGVHGVAQSHFPTISRPNHSAIVTGTTPLLSGVRNNAYQSPVVLDSIMDRAHGAAPPLRTAFVADYAGSLAYLFTDDWDDIHVAGWPSGLVRSALLNLESGFDLLVVIPGGIDAAGHEEGGDSDEYRAAIADVDGKIRAIVAELDLKQDAILITADHGHTDAGGHGGTEVEVVEVPLVLAGAGVRSGIELSSKVDLVDIAPTTAALLGLPPPGHGVGTTIVEAVSLDPEAARVRLEADRERSERNQGVHDKAVSRNEFGRARAVALRIGLVLLMVVAGVVLLRWLRRTDAIRIDWRVLLIGLPAFPVAFYGLLQIFGQNLSLSAFPDRGETLRRVFDYGLISTGLYVVVSWAALHGRIVLRRRLAAANALAFTGVLSSWTFAAGLWAVYDNLEALTLPGSVVLVLVPATYVAVATYAIGVAALLGLEIVVFFARAVDPRISLLRKDRGS